MVMISSTKAFCLHSTNRGGIDCVVLWLHHPSKGMHTPLKGLHNLLKGSNYPLKGLNNPSKGIRVSLRGMNYCQQ